MSIDDKIKELRIRQANHVGEWEEYDRLEDIIQEITN